MWPVLALSADYSERTFVARGPRGLDSTSKETFSPPRDFKYSYMSEE